MVVSLGAYSNRGSPGSPRGAKGDRKNSKNLGRFRLVCSCVAEPTTTAGAPVVEEFSGRLLGTNCGKALLDEEDSRPFSRVVPFALQVALLAVSQKCGSEGVKKSSPDG